MNALDIYTKINIRDYLARPEEKYNKEYSKERQEIRKYIRKDDLGIEITIYILNVLKFKT